MLFTFKSSTGPNLVMLENGAKEILALLGKSPEDAQGIITVEQLPGAIAALRMALSATIPSPAVQGKSADESEPGHPISLSQRAIPFVEMLERALNASEAITWGV